MKSILPKLAMLFSTRFSTQTRKMGENKQKLDTTCSVLFRFVLNAAISLNFNFRRIHSYIDKKTFLDSIQTQSKTGG
jgi:hypothetical protein